MFLQRRVFATLPISGAAEAQTGGGGGNSFCLLSVALTARKTLHHTFEQLRRSPWAISAAGS